MKKEIIYADLFAFGGPLVLVAAFIFIIWSLKKEKGIRALVVSVILLIGFPLWINHFISHEYYQIIPIQSSRTPEEWMDFLGSYLGVAGTIIMGALAYWQTQVNRRQDRELDEQEKQIRLQNQKIQQLHKRIATYQIRPAVSFKKGTLKVYTGTQKQQTNNDLYSQLYFSMHGSEPSGIPLSFLYVNILFLEKGFVPIEKISIGLFEWCIDNRSYFVELSDKKYTLADAQLQILIDCSDHVVESGGSESKGQEFINAMIMHQEYFAIGKRNFDKSRLTIEVTFTNQMDVSTTYRLTYYIYRKLGEDKLLLKNPHIHIIGKKDGN